jgi:hypothetical protein
MMSQNRSRQFQYQFPRLAFGGNPKGARLMNIFVSICAAGTLIDGKRMNFIMQYFGRQSQQSPLVRTDEPMVHPNCKLPAGTSADTENSKENALKENADTENPKLGSALNKKSFQFADKKTSPTDKETSPADKETSPADKKTSPAKEMDELCSKMAELGFNLTSQRDLAPQKPSVLAANEQTLKENLKMACPLIKLENIDWKTLASAPNVSGTGPFLASIGSSTDSYSKLSSFVTDHPSPAHLPLALGRTFVEGDRPHGGLMGAGFRHSVQDTYEWYLEQKWQHYIKHHPENGGSEYIKDLPDIEEFSGKQSREFRGAVAGRDSWMQFLEWYIRGGTEVEEGVDMDKERRWSGILEDDIRYFKYMKENMDELREHGIPGIDELLGIPGMPLGPDPLEQVDLAHNMLKHGISHGREMQRERLAGGVYRSGRGNDRKVRNRKGRKGVSGRGGGLQTKDVFEGMGSAADIPLKQEWEETELKPFKAAVETKFKPFVNSLTDQEFMDFYESQIDEVKAEEHAEFVAENVQATNIQKTPAQIARQAEKRKKYKENKKKREQEAKQDAARKKREQQAIDEQAAADREKAKEEKRLVVEKQQERAENRKNKKHEEEKQKIMISTKELGKIAEESKKRDSIMSKEQEVAKQKKSDAERKKQEGWVRRFGERGFEGVQVAGQLILETDCYVVDDSKGTQDVKFSTEEADNRVCAKKIEELAFESINKAEGKRNSPKGGTLNFKICETIQNTR